MESLPPFASHARACLRLGARSAVGENGRLARAQPGAEENGIHEVTGPIPVSSTNSSHNLENGPDAKAASLKRSSQAGRLQLNSRAGTCST